MKIELYSDQQKEKNSTSSLGTSEKDIFEKIKPIKPKINELKEEYNGLKNDFIRNMLNKPSLQQQDGVKLFSFIEKQSVLLSQINSIFKNYSYNSNKSDDNFITPNTSTNNTNNAKTNEIYNSNTSLQTDSKKLDINDSFVLPNKILEYKEKLDQKDSFISNLHNEISILKEKLHYKNNNFGSHTNLGANQNNKERTVTFGNAEYDANSNFIRTQSQSYFNIKAPNINYTNTELQERDNQYAYNYDISSYKNENNFPVSKLEKNSPNEEINSKIMQIDNIIKLDKRSLEYANYNEVKYEKDEYSSNQSWKLNEKQYNGMPLNINENKARLIDKSIQDNKTEFSNYKNNSSSNDVNYNNQISNSNIQSNKTYSINPSDKLKTLNLNLLGDDYKTVTPHLISTSPIHQNWDDIHKVLNKFDNNKYLENKINPQSSLENQNIQSNLNKTSQYSSISSNLLNSAKENYKSENSYFDFEKSNSNEEKTNLITSFNSKLINNNHEKNKSNFLIYETPEANKTNDYNCYNLTLEDKKILSLDNFNNSTIEVENLNAIIDNRINTSVDRRNDESLNLTARIRNMNTISHTESHTKSIPLKNNINNNSLSNSNNIDLKKHDSSKILKSNSFRSKNFNMKEGKITSANHSLTLLDVKSDLFRDNALGNKNENSPTVNENDSQNHTSSLINNSFSNNNANNISILSNETTSNSKKRHTSNLQLGYSNLKNAAENSKIKKTQNNKVIIKTDKSLNNSISGSNNDISISSNKSSNNSFRGNQNNTSLLNNSGKLLPKLNSNYENNSSSNPNLKRNNSSSAGFQPPKPMNLVKNKSNSKLNKCNSEESFSNSDKKDNFQNNSFNYDNNNYSNQTANKNISSIDKNINLESHIDKYNDLYKFEINQDTNKKSLNTGNTYINIHDDENSNNCQENYCNNNENDLEADNQNVYMQEKDDDEKNEDNENNENDYQYQKNNNNGNNSFRNYTKSSNSNNSSFFTQKQLNFLNSNFDKIREETEEYAEDASDLNSMEGGDLNMDDFKYDNQTYDQGINVNSAMQMNNNIYSVNNSFSAVGGGYDLNYSAGKNSTLNRINSNLNLGSNNKNKKI